MGRNSRLDPNAVTPDTLRIAPWGRWPDLLLSSTVVPLFAHLTEAAGSEPSSEEIRQPVSGFRVNWPKCVEAGGCPGAPGDAF